eukprot:621100-Pyramimonas_sp.AAC.2
MAQWPRPSPLDLLLALATPAPVGGGSGGARGGTPWPNGARSGWTRPQLLSTGRSADDESLEASSD